VPYYEITLSPVFSSVNFDTHIGAGMSAPNFVIFFPSNTRYAKKTLATGKGYSFLTPLLINGISAAKNIGEIDVR